MTAPATRGVELSRSEKHPRPLRSSSSPDLHPPRCHNKPRQHPDSPTDTSALWQPRHGDGKDSSLPFCPENWPRHRDWHMAGMAIFSQVTLRTECPANPGGCGKHPPQPPAAAHSLPPSLTAPQKGPRVFSPAED